jgi:hypothetical protein
MIDPVSAVMTATAAFNGIKRIVEAGQNVEQTFAQIGKWYGAVSDFNEAKRQMENPPLFKKLVATMSVEEEAINVYIQEKKIKEQESQLRELLLYAYGPAAYTELTQLRRKIKEDRERTIYAQERKRRAFAWNSIGWLSVSLMGYGLYLMVAAMISMAP